MGKTMQSAADAQQAAMAENEISMYSSLTFRPAAQKKGIGNPAMPLWARFSLTPQRAKRACRACP